MESRLFQNPPGHQFPFPAGVGGDDQGIHLGIVEAALHHGKLLGGLGDDLQLHFFREHGQGIHPPLLVFLAVVLRVLQLYQMAQRPGDDVLFPRQKAVAALAAAQHPGDFTAH